MNNHLLNLINERLSDLDAHLEVSGTINDNIFIIGAPRSGTTLLSQLFSGCSNAGYPNNLMALFWNAPVTGALLSKKWINNKIFTGDSDFGKTYDIREPHEFGAFWRSHLCMKDMNQPDKLSVCLIDWENLKKTLQNISRVFSVSMVYKAFHLSWFISQMNEILPKSKWIWVNRNTVDNAKSILDLRKYLNNDINSWASLKPAGIEKYCIGNPYLEVVAQVELINRWIKSELEKINKDNWYSLSLESLIKSPISSFKSVANWAGLKVYDKDIRLASLKIRAESFEKNQEYNKIKKVFESYFGP